MSPLMSDGGILEQPKIENLYARCPETHKVGPEFGFRFDGIEQIGSWLVLEKLDGMNMRVVWEPYAPYEEPGPEYESVRIFGRTERAQIPGDLRSSIDTWAFGANFAECFMRFEDTPDGDNAVLVYPDQVILFGEGIGKGIQGAAGQAYGDKRFVLFDVVVDGHWLRWDDVKDVARKLGIDHAPELATGVDLYVVQSFARTPETRGACPNRLPPEVFEGVILRTDPYLFDQRGRRVMAKFKVRDL